MKIHQKFCSHHKTNYNSYVSWCKIQLDTKPPSSIHQPERSLHTSAHTPLPRPFKMIPSIDRHLLWCLWSSAVTGTQWPGTTSHISLTCIHGHSMKMEHSWTRSLWCILCHNQMEILSPADLTSLCTTTINPYKSFLMARMQTARWIDGH